MKFFFYPNGAEKVVDFRRLTPDQEQKFDALMKEVKKNPEVNPEEVDLDQYETMIEEGLELKKETTVRALAFETVPA